MKTIHRILFTFLIFFLALLAALPIALCLPSAALAAESDLARVPPGGRLPRFVDDKGLLTTAQGLELTAKLDEISERHRFDTVVAVVHSLKSGSNKGREVRLYAADFLEQNGFGFGQDLDGIILLLATEDRDFGFATFGFGLKAFTDPGQVYLEKLFLPHLKSDEYFKAFMAYSDAVDDFLTKAKAGTPYDLGNIPLTAGELAEYRFWATIGSLVAALAIALIVTGIWKRQLKTVRVENFANAYIREGSMAVTASRDIFLHRQVHKTKRPKSESKGGGGGSFRSSSGRSSSGRSGKY